jgi:protein-L-isoaspartate(D-aspartate) O-methyltransferase
MLFANSESQRIRMVETQIKARGVKDERVLEAMKKVPRHLFVPSESIAAAYADRPMPIGYGQTISQPYMVALMTEALGLKGSENVLEVGTGSGYQAGVLAELADTVVTTERVPELAQEARTRLRELGYANVEVVLTDGSRGYSPRAPYDAIMVTAGAPEIPSLLVDQLGEEGRLVVPVGNSYQQTLTRLTRHGRDQKIERLEGCVFVPLIGEYGWRGHEDDDRR